MGQSGKPGAVDRVWSGDEDELRSQDLFFHSIL